MAKDSYEFLKSTFLKAYANVPEPLRKEIIVMVDDESFTWQTAKGEILNNTKNAKSILMHLKKMEVI